MKYLLLALCLVSGFTFADRTTTSIRTPSGDLVKIGDSHQSLKDKLEVRGPRHYVLDDGKLYCAATEYVKEVDLQEYTIILCRDRIVKILWRNI
ncbi:hypothetical protein [Acinetobacter variabilis]|uniref:hypothetical protein n=1 Tax=Acinetobacter TaxID=469 RepID=UPI0015D2C509|nr:hypothetical protein [Acinetobacter variabilis]UXI52688.1 hypothetical protein N5980_07035 [Acinetobacter variabilis]